MELSERMKEFYETSSKHYLVRRIPVIIRLDGKSFHTLTRRCEKPFDEKLRTALEKTAIKLCGEIQNVRLAYLQSDEISLLLIDYENLETSQWFDGNIQKIVSVAASIAGVEFSKQYEKDGYFDARVFNIPKEEVTNYFIWRQKDAERNSIQMVAQNNFSHKSLYKLNNEQLQEKLWKEKNINWNDIETKNKRGYCIIKETYLKEGVERNRWIADLEIPIFTQDRNYIERYL